MKISSVFVSHGAPTLVIEQTATHSFLKKLGTDLPRPQAILCVSAHWTATQPMLGSTDQPEMIYDFYGFPAELYSIVYSAPGDPALAQRVKSLLEKGGFSVGLDAQRGLDHGAWVPLKLMYPEANIPVVQLSVQPRQNAQYHLEMGRALQSLRSEGVLILASGGATHNLREFMGQDIHTPPPEYIRQFDAWLEKAILAGDEEELVNWETRAPSPRHNHPTTEHYMPLYVALGAADAGQKGRQLHHDFNYGILSMAAYAWD